MYYTAMRSLTSIHHQRQLPVEITVPPGEARVFESRHAPNFRMEMGSWPFHKLCWVAIGRGQLEIDRRVSDVQADNFLLLPAKCIHRFVDAPSSPLTLMMFCISPEFFLHSQNPELPQLWGRCLDNCPVGYAGQVVSGFPLTEFRALFRHALQEQTTRKDGWRTVVGALATNIIVDIARGQILSRQGKAMTRREAIAGAQEYVDTHPYEQISVKEMSERCNISPRRFSTLFKEHTGETFNRYCTRRRVEYAQIRLRETGHILYACHESGFSDLGYFYRVFKRMTGCTPGQYLDA